MKAPLPITLAPPRRILVRGVNWLGDAVMTTPALLRLRACFPKTHLTLFCPEKIKDLWLNHPAIDETLTFESGEGLFSIGRKLRAGRFDRALVLPNSPRSALEVFLARIPVRIGYARPWRNFFLTQTVPARVEAVKMHKRTEAEIRTLIANPPRARPPHPARAHQIHEYLQLAAFFGADPAPLAPLLTVTPAEIEAAKKKFGLEKDSRPVFGLNPGAEYGPAKRWPVEKFIATAKEVQAKTNCLWLIFGGKNDAAAAAQIGQEISHQNLAGQTSLRELMALLKLCRVLLTNDTGPMHVAAALGTPVVVPFGSTSPELTGPVSAGGLNHEIIQLDAPCSPCFLRECPIDFRCLNGISSERVADAVLQAVR
ncbi:MAG TPA: lipopolysaccharide heptosyltransferase II [Verrucomicrobiae bacterium]|nr:lipopolysaccharide heptosyltransferase II [Verrucomicrobiae bacterium]